jgi:hypothetical protein
MPITFTIDPHARIVAMRVTGSLTDDDVRAIREELRRHPDFDPGMGQLFDARAAEQVALSSDAVRSLASVSVFHAGTRRAFVVANDFQFGMARMFSLYSETHAQTVEVFRDIESALGWLRRQPPAET